MTDYEQEALRKAISEAFVADVRKEAGRPNVAEGLFAVAGAITEVATSLDRLAMHIAEKIDRLAAAQMHRGNGRVDH